MGHKAQAMGQKTAETGQTETGHSRARTPFSEGMSRLSHGTQEHQGRDTAVGQDTPDPAGAGASRPTVTSVDVQQEHKSRMAADPRFAGWVAGGKA